MSAPNEIEEKLLDVSKRFDAALTDLKQDELKALLADEAVLHHDGLTLGSDVKGADEISKYFQAYWEKYQYKHSVIAGAVHSDDKSAFSFWQDQDVKLKDGSESAESTVGIWYHNLDSDHKIKDIWFLRQMTRDESTTKLQENIDQSFPADVSQWSKSMPGDEHDVKRCESMDKAARTFNDVWRTGDPSAAKEIMTEDVKVYDPVFGNVSEGVETFEKMIEGYAKSWKNMDNTVKVACTHSDKAFLWWQSTGSPPNKTDEKDTLYGINMLVFDKDCKICTVVGFRQATKDESQNKVKPEIQRD